MAPRPAAFRTDGIKACFRNLLGRAGAGYRKSC